jgi:ribosome-associated protein YbcJ (S4-like RNA binding protein)
MKFDNLYKDILAKRFLIEAEDVATDTITEIEPSSEPSSSDASSESDDSDDMQKQEIVEDEIISYLSKLKNSSTTYGDLRNFVSSLRVVASPDDAKWFIASALRNKKSEGLTLTKKGAKIDDSDIVSFAEVEESPDEENAYGGSNSSELDTDEDDVFSPEERERQAVEANLPRGAYRDHQKTAQADLDNEF